MKSLYIRNDQKQIDFKKDSKNYYSTNINDKNAYNYIDYLNRSYYGDYNDIYEFHTLNDLLNHTPGSEIITLYSISNKTSTIILKNLSLKIAKDKVSQMLKLFLTLCKKKNF